MSARNDGGPAFPALEEHGLNNGCYGMTLRDYFAAHAPFDLADARGFFHSAHGSYTQPGRSVLLAILADLCGEYADTMLAERAK